MKSTKPFDDARPSTQAWWRCPGVLYFLGVGNPTVAVKIGMIAVTPRNDLRSAMVRRLSSIQSGNHELVYVLGVVVREEGPHPTKDTEDHERSLHQHFRRLARFEAETRGAEWFDASVEMLDHINSISTPPDELGIPKAVGKPTARK